MTPDGKQLLNPDNAGGVRGEIRIFEIMRSMLKAYGYGDAYGLSY